MMQQYRCRLCGDVRYLFDSELEKLHGPCRGPIRSMHSHQPVHSTPMIVHGIAGFMTEHYMLDSLGTLHELNRVLDLEASAEKEVKHLNEARKNA